MDRRRFLYQTAAGVGALSAGLAISGAESREPARRLVAASLSGHELPMPVGPLDPYPEDKPNVILVRFGGGVRRRETVQFRDKTYCPFILHELAEKRGVLYSNVEIAQLDPEGAQVVTSHGQGTLYILTGQYRHYEDVYRQPFADRFIPKEPTVFEYLRARYDVREHEALIINGEDRVDEEFYTFSKNHLFGVNYKSTVLSLYGFKTFLLRQQLAGALPDQERKEKEQQLQEMVQRDYMTAEARSDASDPQGEGSKRKLEEYWSRWRDYYGDSGLVNPRGDRLLTSFALRAMKELRPRLMMINYQDTDYVHWGNPYSYTRAISIIDDGVREIHEAAQADPFYRDRTVFLVIPDCGRDNNRGMAVPYQHHFNSKCAHEVFAVLSGPDKFIGELRSRNGGTNGPARCDRPLQQIAAATTIGDLMGFPTPFAAPDTFLV